MPSCDKDSTNGFLGVVSTGGFGSTACRPAFAMKSPRGRAMAADGCFFFLALPGPVGSGETCTFRSATMTRDGIGVTLFALGLLRSGVVGEDDSIVGAGEGSGILAAAGGKRPKPELFLG